MSMTTTAMRYKQAGRCLWCGAEPVKGNTLCPECVRKRRDRYLRMRIMNVCVQCGKPAQRNRQLCFDCAIKNAERQRVYRELKKDV